MQKQTSSTTNNNGFSLPEVALSMGIAATALLTLISLLPFGLETLHNSTNKQAEARILQTIANSYQNTTWLRHNSSTNTPEPQLQNHTLFYDLSGNQLDTPQNLSCQYAAQITITNTPTLQGDPQSNHYLRQLRIRITDHPLQHTSAFQDNSGKYREHHLWIALLEQTGPTSPQLTANLSKP